MQILDFTIQAKTAMVFLYLKTLTADINKNAAII